MCHGKQHSVFEDFKVSVQSIIKCKRRTRQEMMAREDDREAQIKEVNAEFTFLGKSPKTLHKKQPMGGS